MPRYRKHFAWDAYEEPRAPSADSILELPPLPLPPAHLLDPDSRQQKIIRQNPDFFTVWTPLNVDHLRTAFEPHPNKAPVQSLLHSLRYGFFMPFEDMFLDDLAEQPQIHEDKQCSNIEVFRNLAQKEIEANRYSPRFTKLLPYMRLVPQFAIPKKGTDALRPISDMTASGFNLGISREASRVRYDNLIDLGRYLRHLHHYIGHLEGHLYKCDVSKAYRLLPMHPLVMLLQVVETYELPSKRSFRIDKFGVFGNRYKPRLWCIFFGLVVWSLRFHLKIQIPLHYMDDQFG